MGIGELAPMVKAGLAAGGFILGTLGVAAGSALNLPIGSQPQAVSSVQTQRQAGVPIGGFVTSSKLLSGEETPVPTAEPAVQPTQAAPTVQPTPRPTFVPKPYTAPGPPTTPSQAEQRQKLQTLEKQIADADQKLHTVTFVPQGSGVAQPQPAQAASGQAPTSSPAASDGEPSMPSDTTDTAPADAADQMDN
jgi:hypothetical protein